MRSARQSRQVEEVSRESEKHVVRDNEEVSTETEEHVVRDNEGNGNSAVICGEEEKKVSEKDEEKVESASRRKIETESSRSDEPSSQAEPATQKWLIGHVSQLNKLVSELVCPNCVHEGLEVTLDPQNKGFCTALMLVCKNCPKGKDQFTKSVYTSPRIQESERGDVAFEINTRMVLLAHELGLGYAALEKISKVLGVPVMHLKTYQRHDRKVTGKMLSSFYVIFLYFAIINLLHL